MQESTGCVGLTRSLPLPVVRQTEPVEEQRIDSVTEEDFGEGVLAVG